VRSGEIALEVELALAHRRAIEVPLELSAEPLVAKREGDAVGQPLSRGGGGVAADRRPGE